MMRLSDMHIQKHHHHRLSTQQSTNPPLHTQPQQLPITQQQLLPPPQLQQPTLPPQPLTPPHTSTTRMNLPSMPLPHPPSQLPPTLLLTNLSHMHPLKGNQLSRPQLLQHTSLHITSLWSLRHHQRQTSTHQAIISTLMFLWSRVSPSDRSLK